MHQPPRRCLSLITSCALVAAAIAPVLTASADPLPRTRPATAAATQASLSESAFPRPLVPQQLSIPHGELLLHPDVDAFAIDAATHIVLRNSDGVIEFELPTHDHQSVVATMTPVEPLAPDAAILIVDSNGTHRPAGSTIQIWRGVIAGDSESEVFFGMSDTQAHGWVTFDGRTTLITTTRIGGADIILAYDASLLGPGSTPVCAGALEVPGSSLLPPTGLVPGLRGGPTCFAFDIAIECDWEFTQRQTSSQAAVDYAVLLTAASSTIFSREAGMGLRISYLRVWNREDPWTEPGSGPQLTQFREYWLANMTGVPRATAHLLSGRGLGGGVAYLAVACNTEWSFGVSGNIDGHFPFPTQNNSHQNWDLFVYSHELGHTFGTGHTHNACEYDPVVDGCGLNPDPAAGCEYGVQDCTTATQGIGTIMSYCHICQGGMSNIAMTFGPRVAGRINLFASTRACATPLPRLNYAGISVSPGNPACAGSPVTLTALATGPDLRYQWFRDGQRLTGAILPTLTIAAPAHGARYDLMVYSPCSLVRTLGTPSGITISVEDCCHADFDADGMLGIPDIFAFLSAWFGQQPAADFDADGTVAVPDIFSFLSAWFAGC